MKKLLIGLLLLLVLAGGLLGLAIYNANSLIARHKPALEKGLSDAVGSDVSLGDLSVSLFPSAMLIVQGASVSSRERPGEHLDIERVSLRIELIPLLRGELHVNALVLDGLRVVVLMEEEGMRVEGLPTENVDGAGGDAEAADADAPGLDVNIEKLELTNGTVLIKFPDDDSEHIISDLYVKSSVALSEEEIRFEASRLTGKLNGGPFEADVAGRVLGVKGEIERLAMRAFSGTALADVQWETDSPLPFSLNIAFSEMSVEELSAALAPDLPMKLKGTLHDLTVKITGEGDDPAKTAKGEMTFFLGDGLLEEVNLASRVLGAVKDIPFIAGTLLDAVPEGLMAELDQQYTLLERVEGRFSIADEALITQDLVVKGGLFDLVAKGRIGFDSSLDLDSTIYFNPEFSAALAESVEQIAILFDDQGRLAFPVRITGTSPDLKVFPDLKALLKGTVKRTLLDRARDLLDGSAGEGEGEEEKPRRRLRDIFKR